MKTHKNLFEEVAKFENLYFAYLKARRGKSNKKEVLEFTYNLEQELINLQSELLNGTYKIGNYRKFIIHDPKTREISALPFRDRIVQHAICIIIEPIFDKTFIYDSYACRKGKGTHKGIKRLGEFLKCNKNLYALKCDIKKYFQSINHNLLKRILMKKISDFRLLKIIFDIIDSYELGIPIGNLTSQLFANIFLNELDKYIKHQLKIKFYLRYMDDFVILSDSKIEIYYIEKKIEIYLFRLALNFNSKKVSIFPVNAGIDFLGYVIFKEHMLVRKRTIKRFMVKIKIKIKKSLNFYAGDFDIRNYGDFEKVLESLNSWEAYMNHADAFRLKNSLYQKELKNAV